MIKDLLNNSERLELRKRGWDINSKIDLIELKDKYLTYSETWGTSCNKLKLIIQKLIDSKEI
jgi:hypothetical protein